MQNALWQTIMSDVSALVDSTTFETWFRQLKVGAGANSRNLIIDAPNRFVKDFIEQHYKPKLLSIAQMHSPIVEKIDFITGPDSGPQQLPSPVFEKKQDHGSFPKPTFSPPLFNHNFNFDTFVVGPGNEFAKSATLAVAKAPGKTKFNPLLIYGGVGLGKTHLLQAVGNYLLSQRKDLRIAYSSSEEFYLNFIDAIKNNSTRKFSEYYKASNVLLIDDIQFLSGKESTQEEFFYIFNTLYQNQRQIVLTSDLPPNALKGLQDRLISRFQWGLCVDIQPPNLETRVAILKKKAEQDNLSIPENILIFIAENVSSNIRELEGIIIRLLAYASITRRDITIDLVKSILKGNQKQEKAKFSIEEIIEKVADYYKVPVNNIREKNRRKEVAFCRQIAMYIVKAYTNYSLKSIGLHFGGRDHSTVIHAIQNIEKLKSLDSSVLADIDHIISILSGEKE
jgi:chromosomal replication initiator protein